MKENKPTYMIAQDVKSGYNNVRWDYLLKKVKEKIIPNIQITRKKQDNNYKKIRYKYKSRGKIQKNKHINLLEDKNNNEIENKNYKDATFELVKRAISTPKLKIWKNGKVIELQKGL